MECNFVISGHSRTKNGDSKTYRCKSHTDCPASVRIRQFALEFICQRSGDHADGTVEVQLIREIHKCFLKDLDLMFVSGQTPLSALDQLCRRYGDDDDKKKLLPDISQVRNRKAGWKTEQIKGKWKQLSSHDELFEWAASGLCKNKDNFDSVDEREVLVLDVFRSKDVSDTNESSFGMVLSCKRLLQNFGIAAADGDPVSISCDGTYRLTNAGWTLINVGVVGVIYDAKERQHHQRFYPCVFIFVRTKCELAYETLFESVKFCVSEFLGLDLKPAVGAADHAACITAALQEAWSNMKIVTCWPHVSRKCLSADKKSLLSDKEFLSFVVKPDINKMHKSTTYKHFKALVQGWSAKGEEKYADWFLGTYLRAPFDSWYVGASKQPGSLPQQQGVESFHRSIKAHMGLLYLRAAMIYFLEFSMDQILRFCSAHRVPQHIRPFAEASLLHSELAKAQLIVADATKFCIVTTKRLQIFYINRKDNFKQRVTSTLAKSYDKATDHSLYRVRVNVKVRLDKLEALPNVTNDMIQLFRRKYSCECKAYVQSGWVCSHVLAAASINEHLNLKEVQAGIPHRRLPGRPRKELSCLIRDTLEASEAEDAVFKGPAARLKRHLKKYPTEAIGYKALHRFTTSLPETRGQFQTSCFDGFVSSVQAADDPVTWTISFTDGQTHDVLLDEIVTDLTLATTRQI